MNALNRAHNRLMALVNEFVFPFAAHVSPCYAYQMIGATTLVTFVMLAAMLIVAIGPVLGLMAWLLCLGLFLSLARRLRVHVWGQSFKR